MSFFSDYNKIFDERRIANLDRKIEKKGRQRRANLQEALALTNRREKLLGQAPSR